MLRIRRDAEIHSEEAFWFHARWHFSFSRYVDPQWMGVGALRVFNDDRIIADADWPMHAHQHIESLTYVVEGNFRHADSLGNDGELGPGGAQVMSFSGQGDQHSERNGSETEQLRFIQFWILPSDPDIQTAVQQHQYATADRTDRWLQIMGPAGEEGLDLSQDARALVSRVEAGTELGYTFAEGRGGYLYVIDGDVSVRADALETGDAVAIEGPEELAVISERTSELILVDVPLEFTPVGVWAG